MKGLAAIGAAAFIAMAGVLWFMTRPVLVVTEMKPLRASPDLPTFKQVDRNPDGDDHEARVAQ